MRSSFCFLEGDYPELYQIAILAEKLYEVDASSSIAKSRLFCEKLTALIAYLEEFDISDLKQVDAITQLANVDILPEAISNVLHQVRKSGNKASHVGTSTIQEAMFTLKKLYTLSRWFYETYEQEYVEQVNYIYVVEESSKQELNELSKQVEVLQLQLANYQAKVSELNSTKQIITDRRQKSQESASKIFYDEEQTRIELIDPELRAAGWECDTIELNNKTKNTLPQKGRNMAIAEWKCGSKFADYALFIGLELYGLVEAKRFGVDISTTLQQSKVYAQEVKSTEGSLLLGNWDGLKVPFLFSANGRPFIEQLKTKSGIWFVDIRSPYNHSRSIKGWYKPEGLKALYEQDIEGANQKLENNSTDYLRSKVGLSLRDYQIEAIEAVERKIIEFPEDRRALLEMATGTGKTRTINGLIYRLIKHNRFRRILFLTDRRLLATQAQDSIKQNIVEDLNAFGSIYRFDDLKTVVPDVETRLHFATVQAMVARLFNGEGEPMTVDTYDCVIVDEAHRGYNLDKEMDEDDFGIRNEQDYIAQYRRVLDYFDAFKVGMTATPAIHTTDIFGSSVHSYSYRQAVIDGYLVDQEPPYRIETALNTDGITYQKGECVQVFDEETGEIENLGAMEDELHFDVEHFNKKVINENFNRVVLREIVRNLDPEGQEKTLIFAARDSHADTIVTILKEEFEAMGVDLHRDAIEKITGSVYNNAELTKKFKNEQYPNIVVTVDLLTTGIDIPAICNLVFLRKVRSRILYEQMKGRATRLCPEIGKESFRIYDAVNLYEDMKHFTDMKPVVVNPSYTFSELVEQTERIETVDRLSKQRDQIVAKLNRKVKRLSDNQEETFKYYTQGKEATEFLTELKNIPATELPEFIVQYKTLWEYLDTKVYRPQSIVISEHDDVVREVKRGYGNAEKPEDYIEGFKRYIMEHRNEMMALNIICTRPQELDRKTLKELKLQLDEQGYNETALNTAWKSLKNEDIAADIIAYIRTLALDTAMVTPEERVKRAINKIKSSRDFTKIQLKWIDQFEKQLLAENVLQRQDLEKEPFKSNGGFKRLDKLFNNELENLVNELNQELYTA
ncbi:type I restriction-modification system endonuclease [Myroides odoratimimus]|uniref:Uncharacterized protein n=1 Tax=Myroides odoratimimus CIP 101113 TaxID=883154 RepID=A0AAV3F3I4_9FLAO|nr:type I restriction-modification system endonuclease [Myroides odoratimimus]EHO12575.1 hypothetical protein HMPREF9715_01730 [Myroides odoratimimus CIP 101113]